MRTVVVASLVAASSAHANPIEIVGLTSRHAALANTGIALVDDAAALYYDPAGLVARPGIDLVVGTIGAYSRLQIGERRRHLTDGLAAQLAMRAPLPLAGVLQDRIVVGVALHLLPRDVARIIAPAPDEPFYLYYGERMSRVVVLPGAAVRLGDFAIGASVNVLAGLSGGLSATEGATRAIEARVDERIPTIARVLAGVTWQPAPALRVGAVFRQRFEIPFQTRAETMVAGEPIDLDLRASGHFTPHQLGVGASYQLPTTPVAHVSLDLGYARWSDYPGPYVRVDSRLPLVGAVPGTPPDVPFEDTVSARAGVEVSGVAGFVVRGGYGFETTPVPAAQPGVTNLLDGHRHTIGLGGGRSWGRLRIDAHAQVQLVGERTIEKKVVGPIDYDAFDGILDEDPDTSGVQTSNPGYPGLAGGGQVLACGVTLGVAL